MKMCLSRKMLNTYKLAYIGIEIITFKFTRIHQDIIYVENKVTLLFQLRLARTIKL